MSRLFNGSSDVIEITIRDSLGSKIENRAANMSDKKAISRMLYWLEAKYGLKIKPRIEKDTEFLNF